MANVNIGDRVKYLGPWDPCGAYGWHPYQGQIASITAIQSAPPLPERPITVRFSDGVIEHVTQIELRQV